jgi:predicted dehydrogenase
MKAMVIGLGRVGWGYSKERARGFASSHFGAYYEHEHIDTLIAIDSDARRVAECAGWFRSLRRGLKPRKQVVFSTDYREALNDLNPDIVSVCVPTPVHGKVMTDLCSRTVPRVICLEKPVASSMAEAHDIVRKVQKAYAKNRRPQVAVNFTLRWDESWHTVKRWLPRIEPVVAFGHHPGPLLRSGIHMLDMFNYLFGDPVRVVGESGKNYPSWMTTKMPETDDYSGWGIVEYKQGTRAYLVGGELAATDPYVLFEIQIHGKEGAILARRNGADISLELAKRSKRYEGLKELQLQSSMHLETGTAEHRMAMVDDLVRCARNKHQKPACDLTDAVRAQALVHLIRQSNLKWMKLERVNVKDVIKSH